MNDSISCVLMNVYYSMCKLIWFGCVCVCVRAIINYLLLMKYTAKKNHKSEKI